ncbi:hypothetical protein [Enterobacter roggenkampii]|uniref:hypothetical protein n=1 Tax=Enterobacter roggenkampii TaxID=1812935 RepID=UPI00388F545B
MSTITREQAEDLRNAFQCWQQDYDAVADKEQYDMFGLGVVAMDVLLESQNAIPSSELKMAELINKFYERYPIGGFKTDGERAEALGYFMAGAELQCFGEFVKYEDLCGDE